MCEIFLYIVISIHQNHHVTIDILLWIIDPFFVLFVVHYLSVIFFDCFLIIPNFIGFFYLIHISNYYFTIFYKIITRQMNLQIIKMFHFKYFLLYDILNFSNVFLNRDWIFYTKRHLTFQHYLFIQQIFLPV